MERCDFVISFIFLHIVTKSYLCFQGEEFNVVKYLENGWSSGRMYLNFSALTTGVIRRCRRNVTDDDGDVGQGYRASEST